jgi:hypothetical protein
MKAKATGEEGSRESSTDSELLGVPFLLSPSRQSPQARFTSVDKVPEPKGTVSRGWFLSFTRAQGPLSWYAEYPRRPVLLVC